MCCYWRSEAEGVVRESVKAAGKKFDWAEVAFGSRSLRMCLWK